MRVHVADLNLKLNCTFEAYDALGKIKAPKALADALSWIESALLEFGIAGLSLRALIECLKASLKNSNAAVRSAATKTLVTVKLFAGAGIRAYIHLSQSF